VKNKVMNAVQSNSLLKNCPPNLVVIDEIDGVLGTDIKTSDSTSFIKQLTSLVESSGKSNQRKFELMRPIICICNDLYVPALRPLRNLAKIVVFKKPSFNVIARRLHNICTLEGLLTDMKTLQALVEKADGDIRVCLNTLQFLFKRDHSKGGKKFCLTHDMVKELDLNGKKDEHESIFSIWKEIFQTPKKNGDKFVTRLLPFVEHSFGKVDPCYGTLINGCISVTNLL
jgi:chromosome transmission fidelity protein 18